MPITVPDNVRRLIAQADLPCLLVGNAFFDLWLIPLDGNVWTPPHDRPVEIWGAVGIIDGRARSELAVTIDRSAANLFAQWYDAYVGSVDEAEEREALGPDPNARGTSDVRWLYELLALSDTRGS
jgi:hypothetical protein